MINEITARLTNEKILNRTSFSKILTIKKNLIHANPSVNNQRLKLLI